MSTVTDSLKVTVAVTASSVLKAPSMPALLNAMEATLGPAGISSVMVSAIVSLTFHVSPVLLHRSSYPTVNRCTSAKEKDVPFTSNVSREVWALVGHPVPDVSLCSVRRPSGHSKMALNR